MPRPINEFSAIELASRIAHREISAEDLTRAYLERINERESTVHAWEHLNPEQAIKFARELDKGAISGPLHGLPIGVKDIIDTIDYPTEYGTSIYKCHQPEWDATCVAALKAQGGFVFGKTVTVELAFFEPAKTTNPHNPQHTPGGSSSGSAAAVADHMVPLSIGTQTGGSIIRPAAYCGVVGYKPSFHWINRSGVKLASSTLDTIGFFGRSVADVGFFASAICNRQLVLNIAEHTPKKIGICRTYEWNNAEPETVLLMETVEKYLTQRNVDFEIVDLPDFFKDCAACHRNISAYEMARSYAYEHHHFPEKLSDILKAFLNEGKTISSDTYDAAQELTLKCRAWLTDKFKSIDVMLTPSTTGEAPATLRHTGDSTFNRLWTLMETPAINIPIAKGPNGMPLGLQIIGPVNSDIKALNIAAWLHENFVIP